MDPRVRVKICGVTTAADALAAVAAGADAIGFNFFRGSRRFVSPAAAAAIAARLPRAICRVGVFVNAARQDIAAAAAVVGLSAIQFHGDETPDDCREWDLKRIKALRVRDASAAEVARGYDVDFILADAYVEGQFGGTGTNVAPAALVGFERRRLILAGGLTPENVVAAIRAVRPFAVDVASGVEEAPGKKDAARLRRFIENVRAA